MTKIFAAGALAAALLAGSALPSFATTATYNLGTVNGDATFNLGGPVGTVEKGKFTDFYNFTLGTTATVTLASITNTFTNLGQKITGFAVAIFTGSSTAKGSLVSPPGIGNAVTFGTTAGVQNGLIESDGLGQGNYFVQVSGQTKSASYGGSLSISAVPLPSTVALFGVALAGLGVAGAMRRKSVSSVA